MKYKLGELAKITRGISYKGSEYSTRDDMNAESFINLKCISADGFRWDGIKYYKGNHKSGQSAHEGDLLVANTDLTRNREVIGNSILVPKLDREKICFSHHLTKIEIYNEAIIDRKYLYYLLKAPKIRAYMVGSSDGTTVVMLPARAISRLEIDLPDLETQKKIVRILSALDNKIELNNQQNQTLNRALDELYNEYEATVLRKELLTPAKQFFTFEQGVEPGSKAYYPERLLGMVNFYRVGDMCEKCKNFINSDLAKGKILQKNDVVVSFDATIGRIAYGLEGAYSTGMKKISISNEYKKIVSNAFVYAYFRNKNTQDVMSQCAKGTTILHASSAIDSLAVPYDKNLLPNLSKKISVIFDKLLALKEETETLSKFRDVLLPRLMNGEVDINGIAAV